MPKTEKRRPMIFSTDAAFERLQEEGSVLTARSERKPDGPVWVRRSRTGEKKFDAYREAVADRENPTEDDFLGYARFGENGQVPAQYERAGFESAEGWLDAVKDHHGQIPTEVYIYCVVRDDGGDD